MHSFSQKLINWYATHQRDLPWRTTDNPYKIWLSEIILQQTRVQQGLPYYQKFISYFPTLKDLANAPEDLVMKLWEGLGYYSRARNMHFAAQYIVGELDGKFPDNYKDLLQLKGVGKYTAAAIASFAYKEPVAVVDGNVYRVLSRVFGITDDISQSSTQKIFQSVANDLILKQKPDVFNQAIMDFGALVCKPKQPLCDGCMMEESCFAYRNNQVDQLPVKSKKISVKKRYFHFVLIEDERQKIQIEQRLASDIWQNLYQLPLIETAQKSSNQLIIQKINQLNFNIHQLQELSHFATKHLLTHQQLHIRFFKAKTDNLPHGVAIKAIENHAFPKPLKKFLSKYYSQS